ncbi:MAG: helix-turn-helix domain-containing protein [Oligoflexia bacterium]|nr:helix-turn-helix domain-containing protein [Oligoflexia bacterium]
MAIDNNLTLGQYLRRERERRGLTIEQVASATKIGIRTLHALESDHYAELPAKPFIRGFVISYARFIGLDHKETLTHFNLFLDERVQERPNREGGHSGYAFEKRDGDQSRTLLGLTMGAFIVIGAIAMIFLKPSLKHHHGSHLDKLRATHEAEMAGPSPGPSPSIGALLSSPTPSATPSAIPGASPTPTPTPSPKPTQSTVAAAPSATPSPTGTPTAESTVPDPLNSGFGLKASEITQHIVCKASDSVWVRYRVDDKPSMQFILKKDKVLVLRGRKSVILQVGNPEDLNLSENGGAYHGAASDKNATMRQKDTTFFFPPQLAKTIEEPFNGEKPLSTRKPPASHASPEPSPSSL